MKVSVFWCHICPPWRTSVSTIHHEKLWKRYRISRGNYSANCRNSYTQLRPHMCRVEDLLNVKDWGFMHTSVLRQAFPVDQETNNFVRQVHNQVFLFYILFPLDIILPFSSISSEVVTEILDLKTTARDMTESTAFWEFLRKSHPAKLSFIVPQIRRTSGRERASKSKKLREKLFSYGVFNEKKEYSQKSFISSYKTHSSALWEYAEKEEDKRQNGQNWCATLFPVGSLSQFLMEHPCGRGCRVRDRLFALYWISTFHFIRYFVLIYSYSTITK